MNNANLKYKVTKMVIEALFKSNNHFLLWSHGNNNTHFISFNTINLIQDRIKDE